MDKRYAFLSHTSSCEVLRWASVSKAWHGLHRWPTNPRPLPSAGYCVSNQRQVKALVATTDLSSFGVMSRPIDLLVPNKASFSRGKQAHFHVWSRPVPAFSVLRLSNTLLASGPELTVLELCGSQSKLEPLLGPTVEHINVEKEVRHDFGLDEPLAIDNPLEWERTRRLLEACVLACEFAGTYRLGSEGTKASYDMPILMSMDSLRAMVTATCGTRKTSMDSRALLVADLAFDGSASPKETGLALMLTLPPDLGGYGLPRPSLNVPKDVSAQRGDISDRDDITPDFTWEEQHVVLEYDSSENHENAGPAQAAKDAIRAATLAALGYKPFRATTQSVSTLSGMTLLARQLARALGTELAEPSEIQILRREKAFQLLMRTW